MTKQLELKKSFNNENKIEFERKFDFGNTILKNTEPKNDLALNRLQNKKRRLSNLFYPLLAWWI